MPKSQSKQTRELAALRAQVRALQSQRKTKRVRQNGNRRPRKGGRAGGGQAGSAVSSGAPDPQTGYAAALINPGAAPLIGVPDLSSTKPSYKDRWNITFPLGTQLTDGLVMAGVAPTLYQAKAEPTNTASVFNWAALLKIISSSNLATYANELAEIRPVGMTLTLQWQYASSAAGAKPSGTWYYRMIEGNAEVPPTSVATALADSRWIKIVWGGPAGDQAYITWAPSSGDKAYVNNSATQPTGINASATVNFIGTFTGIVIIATGCPAVAADLVACTMTLMFEGTTKGNVLRATANTYTSEAESVAGNIMSMFHAPAATGQHPAPTHAKTDVLSTFMGFAKKAESLATNPTVDKLAMTVAA